MAGLDDDMTFSSSEPGLGPQRESSASPLNRRYLRASHDYQPEQTTISGSSGGISITAPLREGDVILVHLTHPNGWADGTILSTGTRGWIPTNYCQSYDPRPIRSLLHALTRLWDFLSLGATDDAVFEDRQDYVQGLVAGVRRLLEQCDCLHRDDVLVKRHVGLRRTRKSLLADLSTLMKNREDIHNTFSDSSDLVLWSAIDLYLSNAFKVACRAARFLDIWVQSTSPRQRRTSMRYSGAPEGFRISRTSIYAHSPIASVDEHDLQLNHDQLAKETPKFQLNIIEFHDTMAETNAVNADINRSCHYDLSSPAFKLKHAQTSTLIYTEGVSSDLASERLTAAHEQFLGDIGAFIGLHLQSRTSLDLATTTQLSVRAGKDLLTVVSKISDHDATRSQGIALASDNLRMQLERLAEAANRLCRIPVAHDDPETIEVVDPEDGRGLVAAATACVRAAGDCTAKTRKLLDLTSGDFFLISSPAIEEQYSTSGPVCQVTPRVEPDVGDCPEVVPGAADPQDRFSTESELPEQEPPRRPACLLRSTTDDTNNSTLSSVLPSGNMRRPDSSPPPLIACDSPTSSEPPLRPPPIAIGSPEHCNQDHQQPWTPPDRKESIGISVTEGSSAYQDSLRNSIGSVTSPTSTRATTPDRCQRHTRANPSLCTCGSALSVAPTDDGSDHEVAVLVRSHAHELLYNKDGQIVGGTLAALIENLTSQHAPPDPEYNTAFLLTFRLFTTAVMLAEALIDRYRYAGDCNIDSSPARLRVYNFFKTWLESHYLAESDAPALEIIRLFAVDQLAHQFPGPGQRLADLTIRASRIKVTTSANQLVSAVGRTCVSLGSDYEKTMIPHANVDKEQLYLLMGGPATKKCSFMDLDAMEIARQLTIMESRIFCAIQPQELIGLEWARKNGHAVNVLAMSTFSTNLTNLVVDTILATEPIKKRAAVLKHWIKIAKLCLELNNYSALMAIACSLTTSAISRLRQTWDQLSEKFKGSFEEIKRLVDVSRNYAALRRCLQTAKAPCLPFVGMYLTDLTFVDAGNSNTRPLLNGDEDDIEPTMVINFDKHMRSARIISHLQRYQVPYRFQHVREIQEWLETQFERIQNSDQCTVMSFWRRSQALETRKCGEEDKHRSSVEEKERTFGHGFVGSMLVPRNKASVSGLNAFVHRSKNEILARVKTGGSGNTE